MRKFESITLLLGKVSSVIYILLFIILIFIFAFVYTLIPAGFYHSTIQYEQTLNAKASKISQQLKDNLIQDIELIYKDDSENFNGWEIITVPEFVSIQSFRVDELNQTFSFELRLIAHHSEESLISSFTFKKITVSLATASIYGGNEHRYDTNNITIKNDFYYNMYIDDLINTNSTSTSSDPFFDYNLVFQARHYIAYGTPSPDPKDDSPTFRIPGKLLDELYAYRQENSGLSQRSIDSFIRMLYLSAGILTSTVYGDITPITKFSRSLVLLEAILGIIVIGLFLNSLAYDIRNPELNSSNPVKALKVNSNQSTYSKNKILHYINSIHIRQISNSLIACLIIISIIYIRSIDNLNVWELISTWLVPVLILSLNTSRS